MFFGVASGYVRGLRSWLIRGKGILVFGVVFTLHIRYVMGWCIRGNRDVGRAGGDSCNEFRCCSYDRRCLYMYSYKE